MTDANCDKCRRQANCSELDQQKVTRSGKCRWYQESNGRGRS